MDGGDCGLRQRGRGAQKKHGQCQELDKHSHSLRTSLRFWGGLDYHPNSSMGGNGLLSQSSDSPCRRSFHRGLCVCRCFSLLYRAGESMAQEQTPDDFDWVDAQANCNAASMFVRLQASVVQDVRRRNGLLGRNDGLTFEVYEDTGEFEVTRVVAPGFRGSDAAVKFQHAGRTHSRSQRRRRRRFHGSGRARQERGVPVRGGRSDLLGVGDQKNGARAAVLRRGRSGDLGRMKAASCFSGATVNDRGRIR